MGIFLAGKEVWRNRGKFFLFSLVIALITTLVLFIAALAEGLAQANKEYLSKVDAQLVVFQENVDTSIAASRLGRLRLNSIRRVTGVQAAGFVGLSTGNLVLPDDENFGVSLIGIEPGQPGDPGVLQGQPLKSLSANEAIIDGNLAAQKGVRLGDTITLKTVQGTEEEFHTLKVVGITSGQQYLFAPSIFLSYRVWDKVRPQEGYRSDAADITANIFLVKVQPGFTPSDMATRLQASVKGIEVSDLQTAITNLPGYAAQQSTLTTQQAFTLLIGVLVVGGFFQIQLLQKIPQIGVLKAIGTSNAVVAVSVVTQIIIVTTFGVLLGGLITAGLALGMPDRVPIVFSGSSIVIAIAALLAIGPLGGLVSVLRAVTVEPLIALGLSQ